VDELEEAEVDEQLVLRGAAMIAQPGAQQRSKAFHDRYEPKPAYPRDKRAY
jgi:hypothetical protein